MTTPQIIVTGCAALMLSITACDDKSKSEADREAKVAVAEHSEDMADAKKAEGAKEELRKINEANEEAAEDIADAYEGVKAASVGGNKHKDADAEALSQDKRFQLIDKESNKTFETRAREAIRALDADLAAAKSKNADSEAIKAVEEKLNEARKDLTELTKGSDEVWDDGKVGVTVAINSARRKLERIQEDLTHKY